MAALAAARANPALAAVRERMRQAGKHANVIRVAILRRLIVLANTLVAEDRLWTPTRP